MHLIEIDSASCNQGVISLDRLPPNAMRRTTFTESSRVLIYLAADTNPRAPIAKIATAFDASENHVMKSRAFPAQGGTTCGHARHEK
jgi:hypothetical protein